MKLASVPTVQFPILLLVLLVAATAFFIGGCIEANRLLRWMDNRGMVQSYRAAILRAESSGRFEEGRTMRVLATRYVQLAERDRPGIPGVLCLIGCALGVFVTCVAAGRCLGTTLAAAILRRAGHEVGNNDERNT